VVVLADEQTGGRGRLDRPWASPAGGIWLSVLLRPSLPPTRAPIYTLAAAVAVTSAAREAGVPAAIKWPNDVLVPGADGAPDRKLGGILTEMEGEADRVSWLVVGVGINANVAAAQLPPDAISLAAVTGDAVDRRAFTQRVLETFATLRDDPETVLDRWRSCAATLGQAVRVETHDGTVSGTAVDIEMPGTLVIDTGHDTVRVRTGDCEHLRSQ
jgi:BirA family biotin operon repressor/biotin-[acetyl-CoA-carboxylase] ligase